MQLKRVKSSNVKEIGWAYNVLFVRFNSEKLYVYLDVPRDVYHAFEKADSKGKFLNREIKGYYDYHLMEA